MYNISPQREQLGKKREELTRIRDRTHERWLSYVAYLLQSYTRELIQKKGTEQEKGVLEKFDNVYMAQRKQYEEQIAFYDNQIIEINKEIERLASMGL